MITYAEYKPLTFHDAARRFTDGNDGPRAYLERCLETIAAREPVVKAFTAINEAGETIRQRLGCQSVLITRGEKGMSVFEMDGSSFHIPTMARQVYDVTGAGDTVIATLALSLATGDSIRDGAVLANYAAGIVVGMVGTATVSAPQLTDALMHA